MERGNLNYFTSYFGNSKSAKICGKIAKENRNYSTKHLTKTIQRSAKIYGKKIYEIISSF